MVDDALKEIDLPTLQGYKLALGRVIKRGQINPEQITIAVG